MTEYAYKLVSLKTRGQMDWPALKKAIKAGWEPVPVGEEPDPFPNPLDMTPDQLANFTLHRMDKAQHDANRVQHEQLNAALFANTTHVIIAIFKAEGSWPAIGRVLSEYTYINADGEEEGVRLHVNDKNLGDAKLAYDWLHARGLA